MLFDYSKILWCFLVEDGHIFVLFAARKLGRAGDKSVGMGEKSYLYSFTGIDEVNAETTSPTRAVPHVGQRKRSLPRGNKTKGVNKILWAINKVLR